MATVLTTVSTTGLAVEDRLAFWEHHNAEALVGLTCSSYAPEGLVARQVNLDLDGVRVADISANAHVVERAAPLVRAHPKDAVFASVTMAGQAFFYHPGGCITLRPGDVVVYDTEQPYLFGFSAGMRQLLVDVPRAVFLERGGSRLEGPVPVLGDGAGASGIAARTLRRRLLDLVSAPPATPDAARRELLDLLETTATGRGTPTGVAHLLAAKAHVAGRLGDPRLSPDDIARAVGVSTRHLNRAFAEDGTTVAQYLQAQRLEAARAELVRGPHPGVRIVDVAVRWGFASQAHFSRVFRDRYGRTPSDVRQEARVALLAGPELGRRRH